MPTSGDWADALGGRSGAVEFPAVSVEHLLDDQFFPVCSPRFANGRLPASPEDLARHTLLRSADEYWKPWFEAAGLDWPEPTRGPIFNDSSHLIRAAAEGQGIALARSTLLGNDVRNGVLVRLFDIEVPAPRKHYLVYPAPDGEFAEAGAIPQMAPRRDRRRRAAARAQGEARRPCRSNAQARVTISTARSPVFAGTG
jgi:DNA-binding transcriptional LysR family regulator